jgi:hypothetical protein
VAAPRRHHREAAGAGPIDQIADQRRLVAEGQRVDNAGIGRLLRQQRPAEGIGLDRHVDHVLALRKCFQAMVHGRDRIAGAFDDHVDRRVAHQGLPVVADVRAAAVAVGQRAARALRLQPTCQVGAAVGRQVGDAHQVHAGRARDLRQVHRAELAGADEADAHRPAFGGALLELGEQVHVRQPSSCRRWAPRR